MNIVDQTVIVIPARIGSTRLKKKAILDIGKHKLIEHVYLRAIQTGYNVYVATDSEEIADVVLAVSGKVIMTSENCFSGTDRVYEAVKNLDNPNTKYVINLQGDIPFINHKLTQILISTLIESDSDMATLATKISRETADNPSYVKIVLNDKMEALYFSRSMIPIYAEEYLRHIGVYGFKMNALKRFVHLKPSFLELNEKLEQLRALENGMKIKVAIVDEIPISIDTIEDLNLARSKVNDYAF